MIGDPSTEHHRTRVGFLFLAAGLLLVIWAWGSWLYRAKIPLHRQAVADSNGEKMASAPPSSRDSADARKVAETMPLFVLAGLILVLVFVFGSYAFLRFSRRYRQTLEHERAPPSDARDVWQMHRIPDYEDDEDERLT